MSRSYRKPYVVDGYGTKRKQAAKRSANRTVRHEHAADGAMFKKLSDSWDICDYKFYIDNFKQDYKCGKMGPKAELTVKEKALRIRK